MMNDLLVLEKDIIKPEQPTFMIAGFNQLFNAGNVSSGIPEYLIEKLNARRVGHIRRGDSYVFQIPGSHSTFRHPVKYVEGYEESYQEEPTNDFHYTEVSGKGIVIFIGTEPNQHEEVYVNALLDGAKELGVKRIIVPVGLGLEVPFDRERHISCTYSLKHLKKELEEYAVIFPSVDISATIGMVINHYCKERSIECIRMTALTPRYQMKFEITPDKRAMYDILRRVRYMFGIDLDLSDLEKESKQQISDFENVIKRLYRGNPELESQIKAYIEQMAGRFEELNFEEPTNIPDVFLKEFKELL